MTTLYGIRNCDTVKKARQWLADHDVEYRFHDLRQDGLDATTVERWIKAVGWEMLLNRSGRTWRALPDEIRTGIAEHSAIQLMLDAPTVIKRPVLHVGGAYLVGFRAPDYQRLFC